jgi:hypothetical protein
MATPRLSSLYGTAGIGTWLPRYAQSYWLLEGSVKSPVCGSWMTSFSVQFRVSVEPAPGACPSPKRRPARRLLIGRLWSSGNPSLMIAVFRLLRLFLRVPCVAAAAQDLQAHGEPAAKT